MHEKNKVRSLGVSPKCWQHYPIALQRKFVGQSCLLFTNAHILTTEGHKRNQYKVVPLNATHCHYLNKLHILYNNIIVITPLQKSLGQLL